MRGDDWEEEGEERYIEGRRRKKGEWCFAKSLCYLLNCRHKSKADLQSKSVGSM